MVAPLELATTLTGLVTGPSSRVDAAAVVLILSRVVVAAVGLLVGRRLIQPDAATRGLAPRWALADLVTLAILLATGVLPSNRLPGTAPLVWAGYALLDGLVVIAARRRGAP